MFDITLFLYQMFGMLFVLIVPLTMTLMLIWFIAKICKGMFRSIMK